MMEGVVVGRLDEVEMVVVVEEVPSACEHLADDVYNSAGNPNQDAESLVVSHVVRRCHVHGHRAHLHRTTCIVVMFTVIRPWETCSLTVSGPPTRRVVCFILFIVETGARWYTLMPHALLRWVFTLPLAVRHLTTACLLLLRAPIAIVVVIVAGTSTWWHKPEDEYAVVVIAAAHARVCSC